MRALKWLALASVGMLYSAPSPLAAQGDDPPSEECIECNSCPTGHEAWGSFEWSSYSEGAHGWHTECFSGGCTEHHGVCGGGTFATLGDDVYEAVRLAARQADVKALTTAILKHPGAVLLNENRLAIQIVGCKDQFRGHFRIPQGAVEALRPVATMAMRDGHGLTEAVRDRSTLLFRPASVAR